MTWNQIAEGARHPLVITVVGFVLTGILGAVLSWELNSIAAEHEARRAAQQKIDDRLAAAHERATIAVRDIIDLINERRTRAILVASAIRRKASQTETETRKQLYDQVYVQWNAKEQSISLQIREMFKQISPSNYEGYLASLTFRVAPVTEAGGSSKDAQHAALLSQMDQCITDAFDAYRQNDYKTNAESLDILKKCQFDVLDTQITECSRVMGESLYSIVSGLLKAEEIETKVHDDRTTISFACSPDLRL